jgi:putative hydrolase of HD superfamily
MTAQLQSILKVLKLAERLKFELRHSYTSSGRRESVAEHS